MPQLPKLDLQPLDLQPLDESISPDVEEPSLMNRLWTGLTSPLWTGPSALGQDIETSMSQPSEGTGPMMAMGKGFIGGALRGIGDLVSGLTSPIDLGTAALTGGSSLAAKSGLRGIASGLRQGARAFGVLPAIHGTSQVLDPESTLSERGLGLAELAGGTLATRLPDVDLPSPTVAKSVLKETIPSPKPKLDIRPIDDYMPNEPKIEVIDDISLNASGESAASMEALSRQKSMKSKKQQYVVYDRAGNERPLIGPDAVDYTAKKGETYGIKSPTGFQVLDDKGGLVKPKLGSIKPESIFLLRKEKATPELVKKAQSQGYQLVGLNDKGDFRFQKSTVQPKTQPILESEVLGIRPTSSRAKLQSDLSELGAVGPITDVQRSNPLVEAFNLPRGIMASMDFSAPLRQGLPLIHKKEFWTSLKPMFQSWASEDSFRKSQDAIKTRALFMPRSGPRGKIIPSFAEESGLSLTDLTNLSKREEAIMSTWAEKIPGVRRSNRAYTAFLNNLRADTFESLIKDSNMIGANAQTNLPLARALADFVNTASGRGSLGKLEKSAVTLNTMLFSPRLIASRLKLLNPAYYVMAQPQVRKEALKSLFAVTAAGNTVGQLGKMAGGEVDTNPNSSDFGKVKIGNVRIDPWAGFQQYIVAANRLLRPSQAAVGEPSDAGVVPLDLMSGFLSQGGQSLTSSQSGNEYDLWNPNRPFDPTHGTVAGRFARGKLHPTLGFAVSLLTGKKELSGQEMDLLSTNPFENAIAQRFIPIVMQDIYEVSQENPELVPLTAPLSAFGMGVQSYQP